MAFLSAKWLRIASSQRLCRSSQAVSVVDQKTYVFGGELVPREPIGNQIDTVDVENENEKGRKKPMQFHAFANRSANPSVNTIPAPAEAPIPRVGSPSTTINGNIWIFSGRGGLDMKPIEEQGTLWRYEPGAAKWSSVKPADPAAPYPAGRSYHCVTSDGKSKIFIHSGCPETGRLADLWMFDIEDMTWTELPLAPAPSRGGASIAYADGKLYRVNGFDGINEQGGSLDVFDIPSLSWSTMTYNPDNMEGPEARSVGALLPVMIHGSVHLVTMFGERDPSALGHAGAGKMLPDAWAWDIKEGKWQKLRTPGQIPEPRGWFDADVVRGGNKNESIIVHGGLNENNERLGDIWKLVFD
ncbi:kelch repeat protein [Verticillium alfalfae VaMs.102]|uniref:Kelch repeat protein n=1 Tax=Verticillium alfalfae (strain VaMs.102 / ATCC MYA-4576 / FGSC 10136) TaxID=526221 RepID=C9SNA8_VERA1|nr:kelch repeat protein [Verticillium alfalfae VaMs.102]EEY20273.1 kelch repeat protein [Verticillium alfalfae VaMs.102]